MRLFKNCLMGTLVVLLCVSISNLAQDDSECPVIVELALASADTACGGLEINQVCYGNARIVAEPQTTAVNFKFDAVGDIANITDIEAITLSGMNIDTDEWGVAVLRAQANAPGALPGQSVVFVMFGDVEVRQAAAVGIEFTVTATHNINVRNGTLDTDMLVGTLLLGEAITADGRLPDSSWLRVHWPNGIVGWVPTDQVQAEADVLTLPVALPGALTIPGGSQMFYFRSGIGDAPCEEAPESGILIQTPEGFSTVNLLINEVHFALGSTAYLQAQPGGGMMVNMLEGQSWIESFGGRMIALAGTRLSIPLGLNWAAAGQPSLPEPYEMGALAELPLSLLERDIAIAEPLDAVAIALSLDNPLAEVAADGQCTVLAVPDNVDLYTGPSTEYEIIGTLVAWDIAQPEGIVINASGETWWQLPLGSWIKAEAVLSAGDCAALPVVDNSSP